MTRSMVGVFNPQWIPRYLEYLQGLASVSPPELYGFMSRVREAELIETRTSSHWGELVHNTAQEMAKGLGKSPADVCMEAEAHVDLMVGDNLIRPSYFLAYLFDFDRIRPFIRIIGQEHVDRAVSKGKGAILAQFHWGPFQLLLPTLLGLGYPVLQFYGEAEAAVWAEEIIRRSSSALSDRTKSVVIPDPAVGPKVLRALRSGYLVAIPPEISQGIVKPKLETRFLGQDVYAPEGPAYLAGRVGVPLIPVRVEGEGPYLHLIFGEPIEVESVNHMGLQQAVDKLFQHLECEIRKTPRHWRGWGFIQEMTVPEGRPNHDSYAGRSDQTRKVSHRSPGRQEVLRDR